ncbi:hypothetical protein SO694_00019022 [Aureococcus anophagefferens]
MSTTI